MKSKIKKNKSLAYILAGAGAIALTGMAFGSWVISQTPTGVNTDPIKVVVADVQNKTMVAGSVEVSESNIRFDAVNGDTAGAIRHDNGDAGGGEDLDFTITFSLTNCVSSSAWNTSTFGGIHAYMVIDTTSTSNSIGTYGSHLVDASSLGNIVFPLSQLSTAPSKWAAGTGLSLTADSGNPEAPTGTDLATLTASANETTNTTADFTLTCKFGWGSTTDNTNPGKWEETESNSLDVAISVLEQLKNAKEANFTVYIVPQAATN